MGRERDWKYLFFEAAWKLNLCWKTNIKTGVSVACESPEVTPECPHDVPWCPMVFGGFVATSEFGSIIVNLSVTPYCVKSELICSDETPPPNFTSKTPHFHTLIIGLQRPSLKSDSKNPFYIVALKFTWWWHSDFHMNKWNPGTTGLTRHRLVTATKCHQKTRDSLDELFFSLSRSFVAVVVA